jgi:hypothetical protein
MPTVGDRVIIEGNKVGQQRREGTLVESIGSLIKVRWADGTESMFTPGAGSVRYESSNGKEAAKAAKTPAKAASTKGVKMGAKPAPKVTKKRTTEAKPVAKAKTAKAKAKKK